MSAHEQFAEDLALYALGVLTGDERTALERHLQDCASCRRELEQLRGDSALIALSVSGPQPPARARARFTEALAEEPRAAAVTPRAPFAAWFAALGWIATAAVIVVAVTLWRQNTRLHSTVVEMAGMMERQRAETGEAQRLAELMKASDATSYQVLPVDLKTPPPPAGKAIYSASRNGLVFVASNLRPLPSGKAYELWLVPKQGAPIPAGVFKPDVHGGAMMINPPMPGGVEAKAFAITVEPEQGSAAPTLPIIMMGAGS